MADRAHLTPGESAVATFRKAGISATFWAVALFLGVLVIIGIIAWLRRTQHEQPTNPAAPKVSYQQTISLPPYLCQA